MNKTFLQSLVIAIASLSLATSCSYLQGKKSHNKCSGKGSCATKTNEKSETKETKTEKSSEVKSDATGDKSVKKSKKSKKSAILSNEK